MTTPSIADRMISELNDAVSFYGEDPHNRRAEEIGICQYSTVPDAYGKTRRCAVGRLLTRPELLRSCGMGTVSPGGIRAALSHMGHLDADTAPWREVWERFDSLFTPRARGLPRLFWAHLQGLHDTRANWVMPDTDSDDVGPGGYGLTHLGESVRADILGHIRSGDYEREHAEELASGPFGKGITDGMVGMFGSSLAMGAVTVPSSGVVIGEAAL